MSRRVESLARATPGELERMWRNAPAARAEDLQGELRAHFVYLRGEKMLPGAFRRLLHAFLFSPLFPLRAKRTRGRRGINRFGFGMGQLGFAQFDIRQERAWDSDKEVLVLDYDLAANPGFVRPIRDEMCRLEPGLYLGRMGWRVRASTWLGLYFTLGRRL